MSVAYALEIEDASPFALADEYFTETKEVLSQALARGMAHDDVEHVLAERGRELCRRLLQAHVAEHGERRVAGPVVGAEGVERTRERRNCGRALGSLFGDVEVRRRAHQSPGVPSLHPVDAWMNLPPEKYSLGVRRDVAWLACSHSFDEVIDELRRNTGAHVPKRQVEELAGRAATDFEAFYGARRDAGFGPAPDDSLLVLSFDAKGVVMRPEGLRAATRVAADAAGKTRRRLGPGEKKNRKRMAQVAAVFDRPREPRTAAQVVGVKPQNAPSPRPSNKRVWASLKRGAREVINDAFADANARDPQRLRTWVVLVDGDWRQLEYVRDAAKRSKARVRIVVDVIHVTEYLWSAAVALYGSGGVAAEHWVNEQLLALLRGRCTTVIATMRDTAGARGISGGALSAIDKSANYLEKYQQYLRYDKALADGLPISTGVIEGACRHLVKARLERPGARWLLDSAEAVLQLRALRLSGDFDEYWQFHRQREYERNHASRYANGDVPASEPSRPAYLSVIK